MENQRFQLVAILILISSFSFGQRLKKADKIIVSNLQAHINFLNDKKLDGRKTGSPGEELADDYIHSQLEKQNIRPMAENGSWFQKFNIYDGREVMPGSFLMINGKSLKLFNEFFPFCFSANKKAEASVAVALSENGVPWFADLKDLTDGKNDTGNTNTSQLIRLKAGHAASKGATALIVFNKSDSEQLVYKAKDDGPRTSIPVLYVTKPAVSKYLSDESANIDLKLNVELQEKERKANNVVGFVDNKADSTILIAAHLDQESDVAALLEVARLLKKNPQRSTNYLFVVYTADANGAAGSEYFSRHAPIDFTKLCRIINMDALGLTENNQKGLSKVKEAIRLIQNTNAGRKALPNKKA